MEYEMSSKKSPLSTLLLLGLPLLAIGLYFILWAIYNDIYDEYFSLGIWFTLFGGTFILCGFVCHKNYLNPPKCSIHPETESVGECAECGSAFCADCLAEVNGEKFCPSCYDKALEKAREQAKEEAEFISKIPLKSKTIALLLCVFLWLFGLHMFYLGYSSKGTARLIITLIAFGSLITPFGDIVLTITLFFKAIHAIIDLFSIAGNMRDAYGRKLV